MIIIKITKLNEQLDKEPIKKRAIIKQGAFYYINFLEQVVMFQSLLHDDVLGNKQSHK